MTLGRRIQEWRYREERIRVEVELATALRSSKGKADGAPAVALAEKLVALAEKSFGPHHPEVGVARYTLGVARLGVDAPALPAVGWDRGRPLIFALAEPPHDGPIGTIAATTPLRALAGLRHQILIPASDVPALSSALVDAITSRSKGPPPRPVAGILRRVGPSS